MTKVVVIWEGIPKILPVEGSIERPVGKEPERIEKERKSPWYVGIILFWTDIWYGVLYI